MSARSNSGHRIAILIETREWGGAEVHTAALARTLHDRGHAVTIGLLNGLLRERFAERAGQAIPVVCLDAPGPQTVSEWRRRLRELQADIGVFAKNWMHAGSVQLDVAARLTFGTYVTIEHLMPSPLPPYTRTRHLGGLLPGVGLWWWRQRGLEFLRSRSPKWTFAVSHAVRQALIADHGYRSARTRTIHNGIDSSRFVPSPTAGTTSRAAWGVPTDAVLFGTVGRLSIRHKGLDLAIEAFARLRRARPERNAWLVLVGDGPDRETLTHLAATTGVTDRTVFVGHTENPANAYPAIDYLLMPSRFEGLPLSLMEAMACGCCPIAARVSGIPEIITSPALGWLIEGESADSLAEAMAEALDQPCNARASMSEQNRTHIVEHFSAAAQFAQLAAAIECAHAGLSVEAA